jgi:hypothetical protein
VPGENAQDFDSHNVQAYAMRTRTGQIHPDQLKINSAAFLKKSIVISIL